MVMVNDVSSTTRSLFLTCPDVTDKDGDTPLDYAVGWRYTKVIDYLKSHQPSTPEPGMCL